MHISLTFIFVVAAVATAIARAIKAARAIAGSKTWTQMTTVERGIQRELEQYVRGRKPAVSVPPLPAAAPPPPPKAAPPPPVYPKPALGVAAVTPPPTAPARVAVAPPVAAPKVVPPLPPRRGAGNRPQRRPVRLNARVMGRVAILSEIWRPPLALRPGQPWDRS